MILSFTQIIIEAKIGPENCCLIVGLAGKKNQLESLLLQVSFEIFVLNHTLRTPT
jgi:hypothetical protein